MTATPALRTSLGDERRRCRPGLRHLPLSLALGWGLALLLVWPAWAPEKGSGPAGGDGPSGVVKLKGIQFDLRARRIIMDGRIALGAGVVELFACVRGTKDYESVVALDAQPYDLHLGLLALGLKPGRPVPGAVAPFQIRGPKSSQEARERPVGPLVVVWVRWKDAQGRTVTRRAEDLILNVKTKKPMERAGWVFVGSRFVPGEAPGEQLYAAVLTGAVITTYNDPTTVLDNPRPTGQDDTYFIVNEAVVPPVGTPVQVIVEPEKKSDVPAQP